MLIVLSPAKSLDYKTPVKVKSTTLPDFTSESAKLIAELKKLSPQAVAKLMGLSDQLAALNVGRYRDWSKKFTEENMDLLRDSYGQILLFAEGFISHLSLIANVNCDNSEG